MPYIKNDTGRRDMLTKGCRALNAGELNFQIASYFRASRGLPDSNIVSTFVARFVGDTPNYQKYNDLTGCLVCCHKEIKRRFGIDYLNLLEILDAYDDQISTYEDLKMKENGDF